MIEIPLSKQSLDDLIFRLAVVLDQCKVMSRGANEHPNDETFIVGCDYFRTESIKIIKEIIKRKAK